MVGPQKGFFFVTSFCKEGIGILGQENARIFFCIGAIQILTEGKEC